MLVLGRRKDEKIMIGDNITITVVAIRGDSVRFGIDAPKDVSIHREEVYELTQEHLLGGNVVNCSAETK